MKISRVAPLRRKWGLQIIPVSLPDHTYPVLFVTHFAKSCTNPVESAQIATVISFALQTRRLRQFKVHLSVFATLLVVSDFTYFCGQMEKNMPYVLDSCPYLMRVTDKQALGMEWADPPILTWPRLPMFWSGPLYFLVHDLIIRSLYVKWCDFIDITTERTSSND